MAENEKINKHSYTDEEIDSGGVREITVNDMVCKDCLFAILNRAGICFVYKVMKPATVIHGGKCSRFVDFREAPKTEEEIKKASKEIKAILL